MNRLFKGVLYFLIVLLLLVLLMKPIINWQRKKRSIERFNYQNLHKCQTLYDCIKYTDITWKSRIIEQDTIEKVAFFIQPKVKSIGGSNLYFQFDTGSATTMLYGNTLKNLSNHSLEIQYNADSSYVYDFEMTIGNAVLSCDSIKILKNFGSNKYDSTFMVLGTIGYDAIYKRTLVMDFKNDKLAIMEKDAIQFGDEITFHSKVSIDKYPPFITGRLGRKKVKLFYDTGSSMFPVITNPKKLKKLGEQIDTLCCISAWGKEFPIYKTKSNRKFKMGELAIDSLDIYGDPRMDKKILNIIPWSVFFGITGNKIFEGKIIVVDTENNKFGFLEKI